MTIPSSNTSQILSIEDLRGPAGRLEAVMNTGIDNAPFAAVVCHPHPPSGGTMHTKAVYHAMKAFLAAGLPVVRFNFRGVGLSEGSFDDARGEQDDVLAVLDWMEQHLRLPILLAGFSFGAYVGFRASRSDERVKGRVGLGLPVQAAGRDYTYEFLGECRGPKLFVSGDQDQFSPREVMEHLLEKAPEPRQMVWIKDADHFFQGVPGSPAPKLSLMSAAIGTWLTDQYEL